MKTLMTESQKRNLELMKRESNEIIRTINWLVTEDLNRPSLLIGIEDVRKQTIVIASAAVDLTEELEAKK